MSTPGRELVAAAHVVFSTNEAALKQQAIMFNRIAIQGLSLVLQNPQFVTPDFAKNRAMLAEMGVLFEPDMDKLGAFCDNDLVKSVTSLFGDINKMLEPFGLSVEEMIAARKDEEEFKAIKEKTKLSAETLAAKVADPQKLIETERRLTVNLARIIAIQLRNLEKLDAYAIIPSEDSTLDCDDRRPTKHDVVKITVVAPVPNEHVPWQQILQYRNDPDAQNRFRELKGWMSDIARGSLKPVEIGERIEYLLDQYRRLLETHHIPMNWMSLEAFVVTTPDVLDNLASFRRSHKASILFSLEDRKLSLLEGESMSAGSHVAFVIQAKSMLSS